MTALTVIASLLFAAVFWWLVWMATAPAGRLVNSRADIRRAILSGIAAIGCVGLSIALWASLA